MRRFAVLAAALIGASAAMFSVLSVNQAIANIQAELPLVDLEPRWILNAYLVALSVPMLAAGALGDRFGRRSVLLWGSLLFAGASAAVALVENVDHLIAVRAVQGIGAALLVPSTLSTLSDAFPDGSSRGFSVGLWAALSTVAFAAGPITGVWILEQGHNWRWFFYVNAIAGALAFLLGMAAPKVRGYSGRHLDVSGILLGTLGIGLLAYALVEGNFTGWRQELTAGALLAGAFFLVVFLLVESHKSNSMVLLPLSNSGTFPAANAVATMNFLALLGISVFLPTYFRNLLGYPTDVSFLRLVPFAGLILVVAPVAGMVSEKAGSRLLMTFGNLLAAGGLGLLLQARLQADYESDVLPALVLMGFGFALSVGPLTTATVGVVQDFHAGGASGATGSARLIGILLGIGLLGAVVMTAFRNGLAADLAAAGIDTATAQRVAESPEAAAVLGGGSFEPLRNTLAPGTPPNVGDQVLGVARDSFLDAVNTGMLMSIGFLLLAAVIALIFVRSHVISLFRVESEKSPPEGRAPVEPTPAAAAAPASDPEPTPRVVESPPPGVDAVAEKPEEPPAAASAGAPASSPLDSDSVSTSSPEEAQAEAEAALTDATDTSEPDSEVGTVQDEELVAQAVSGEESEVGTVQDEELVAQAVAATDNGSTADMPAAEEISRPDAEPALNSLAEEELMSSDAAEPGSTEPAETPLPALAAATAAGPGGLSDPQNNGSEAPESSLPSGDYAVLLYQFAFKAGTGSVADNITAFLRSALAFYEDPSAVVPTVPLPESVAAMVDASTSPDIATMTGYLLLEQRFGRVNPKARPEFAATALVGAARSVRQWNFRDGYPMEEFLEGTVKVVMEGISPARAESELQAPA